MGDFLTKGKDKMSFRVIVLEFLKKILELSTSEFRGGFYNIIYGKDSMEKVYVPDARRQFIQATECFGIVLTPHFNDKMKEKQRTYNEAIKDKCKRLEKDKQGSKEDWERTEKHLELAKGYFKSLNILLGENQYLKSEVYTQKDLYDDDDDDEAET